MTTKVLLVDDNLTFLYSVKMFLGMLPNMKVVGEAHNGPAALTQADRLQPDLALLDIATPEMNGLELARQMQSLPRPPRIVFLARHDSLADRAAASSLGADGYVRKADFVTELFPIMKRMAGETSDSGKPH